MVFSSEILSLVNPSMDGQTLSVADGLLSLHGPSSESKSGHENREDVPLFLSEEEHFPSFPLRSGTTFFP